MTQGSSKGVQISIIPHFYSIAEPRIQILFLQLPLFSIGLETGESFTKEMTLEPSLEEPESLSADWCEDNSEV